MKLFGTSLLTFVCVVISSIVFSQTPGTLSVSVKTVTHNGQYAPKHIMAIWIDDSTGIFVKTCLFRSQNTNYRKYLTKFKSETNNTYNTVDAVTGATYPSHNIRTATWNGKDVNGNVVPDGEYIVCIEFTESNGTGPNATYRFTKSDQLFTLNPINLSNFQQVSIAWTPTVSVEESAVFNTNLLVYPNPVRNFSTINLSPYVKNVCVTDIKGRVVDSFKVPYMLEASKIQWIPDSKLKNGVYFIVVDGKSGKQTTKVILER